MNELEYCLNLFGWKRGGKIEQFLNNDDHARDAAVFYHPEYKASVFALGALVDRRKAEYAPWALYREGTLVHWGGDVDDLLAYLSRMRSEQEPGIDEQTMGGR